MESISETGIMIRVVALALLFGIAHWGFVKMALEDIIQRERVIGGKKAPWVLAILFITCLGSVLYLVVHPELNTAAKRVGVDDRRY